MTVKVRPYQAKDKERLQEICIETSAFSLEKKGMYDYLLLMYNDYYTENEPESVLVAADENDEAVGYLLCAKDCKKYQKIFVKSYLPRIARLGVSYFTMAVSEMLIYRRFGKKHPAHLHIDLTEKCRRQGVGSRMMDELKASLKEKGIDSVMLSCGARNAPAISFYQKNSFEFISSTPAGKLWLAVFDV